MPNSRTSMQRLVPSVFLLLLSLFIASPTSLIAEEDGETFFESKVRPILIERCFECHGRESQENGLCVDSRDALLKGGESGAAILPGKADGSLLVQAIRRTHQDLQMPPKEPLPPQVVADFVRWVNDGAVWPAFEPVTRRRSVSPRDFKLMAPNDAAFQPALQLWLKADTGSWQDGQAVHLWEDASGRGHDLAATAGARKEGTGGPVKFIARSSIGGAPAMRFEMNSGLGGNAATAPNIKGDAEFTMLIVMRVQDVPSETDGLVAGFGEPAHPDNPGLARCAIIGLQAGDRSPRFIGGWGNDAVPKEPASQTIVNGPPVVLVLTKQQGAVASASRFFLNGQYIGELTGNADVPDFGRRDDLGFFMGHARSWLRGFTGEVAEVILYNRALTDDERNSIEGHLSARYRIPLKNLDSEEIIEEGDPAFHTQHWAFAPLQHPEPPVAVDSELTHPIDRFVAAGWREHGLHPVGLADSRTLVRRLYFDLIGLPPTPEALEQAVGTLTPWNDTAWAALIDRLLASPQYGERWGRHWLDVARYADTAGDNADYPIPEARLYRDYVIDAFNKDMPYDQFVREQLAGDILASVGPRERYAEQVIATGFLALSRRYATGPYELWHLTLEDTIDTVGQTMMGLTLRCARCHDHKFDPVSQRDYYALYGIFESTQFPWAGAEEFQSMKTPRMHFVPLLPAAEAEPLLRAFEESAQQLPERIAQLELEDPLAKSLASLSEKVASLQATSAPAADIAAAERERDAVKQQLAAKIAEIQSRFEAARRMAYPPEVPSAYAVCEGTPRPAVLQRSGDPGKPGSVVTRGMPAFLIGSQQTTIPESQSGRLQLAEWLTHPDHPLTARVMVNRVWQHHFARGLVASPSNFGIRGSRPTYPALLDWLAHRFITEGWSVKKLHRLILTSRVWRLASTHDSENMIADPANAFLWRHDRQRLEAEAIRDSILAISGRLDPQRPGAHPFPPITSWGYTQHNQFRDFYPSRHRSVYLMTSRLQRHPFLALFDGPDTNTTTDQRKRSIVPSQALYLMNSQEVKSESEAFAQRILAVAPESRIAQAYALVFQREPSSEEAEKGNAFLAAYTERSNELAAWTSYCRSLLISHEFFYVD